jgi:hypothetical protein
MESVLALLFGFAIGSFVIATVKLIQVNRQIAKLEKHLKETKQW